MVSVCNSPFCWACLPNSACRACFVRKYIRHAELFHRCGGRKCWCVTEVLPVNLLRAPSRIFNDNGVNNVLLFGLCEQLEGLQVWRLRSSVPLLLRRGKCVVRFQMRVQGMTG